MSPVNAQPILPCTSDIKNPSLNRSTCSLALLIALSKCDDEEHRKMDEIGYWSLSLLCRSDIIAN